MRERVTHENHPNTQNLQQQSFTTLFIIYMTHLPVWLNSVAWFPNTGTAEFKLWSLPINTGSYFFFIAYRKLILNYAKAFITLYPWIKSSISPRVLLGLVLNLL